MEVVSIYDNQEVEIIDGKIKRKPTHVIDTIKPDQEMKEKITTLEKSNDELNHKLNQRDAELKICYVNIALLVVVIFLIIAFKVVKNIRKGK